MEILHAHSDVWLKFLCVSSHVMSLQMWLWNLKEISEAKVRG